MAVEFTSRALGVPGGAGTKVVEQTIAFNGTVTGAEIALKASSSSSQTMTTIPSRGGGAVVRHRDGWQYRPCRCVVSVRRHNLDDPYTGNIEVLVIANTE